MWWLNLIFFIVACLVLIYSGTWLVKSLVKIASFLRLTEFLVSFIIIAMATTLPELFVGINSALTKSSALSLGNVFGSNIVNLTLILGIAVILGRGINVPDDVIKKDGWYMFSVMLLPFVLMYIGGALSRIDAVILIAFAVFHFWRLIIRARRYRKPLEDHVKRWHVVLYTFLFILSSVMLFVSSSFVVKYAKLLSIDFALPPIMIGLFLVAIGTSLPELVFSVRSSLSGHPEFVLGDLIGAAIINSTLVLGITALIMPITANLLLFLTSGIFMIIIGFLLMTFVTSGKKLDIKEGLSLILIYIIFIIVEINLNTLGGGI